MKKYFLLLIFGVEYAGNLWMKTILWGLSSPYQTSMQRMQQLQMTILKAYPAQLFGPLTSKRIPKYRIELRS